MKWQVKKFDDLDCKELYAILQLRNEVFVVEQNCVYQDCDDKDLLCYHFMGWNESMLVAYTRLVPPGVAYKEPSIGRVVTKPVVRRKGFGNELMQKSIEHIYILYGVQPIRIGAQFYLLDFYHSLGFVEVGEIYYEDGIKHIEMVKS